MKLPEPVTVATVFATGEKVQIPGYTAEQMLAWGKACAEAERDAIAQMFEAAPELVPFAKNDRGGCITCGFIPRMASIVIRARGNK
jgi:hypothetical protein